MCEGDLISGHHQPEMSNGQDRKQVVGSQILAEEAIGEVSYASDTSMWFRMAIGRRLFWILSKTVGESSFTSCVILHWM
jgi:hypothetical protein